MPAPMEEWLAHLWPAVALGPLGNTLMAQLAELAPIRLLEDLAAPVRLVLSPDGAPAKGDPGGRGAPASQTASPDSHSYFPPGGGGMSFLVTVITLLAACAGLVSLARLLVGEDFFSMRWLR